MIGRADERISRYVMHAFGRSQSTARIPRSKPGERRVVTTARIVLSVQFEGNFAYIPLSPVDIRADSAEWYGYLDGIPSDQAPTMLDVITQAHEFIYGDIFNERSCRNFLDIDEDGILRTMLGYPGTYTCFVINGQYAYDADSEYGMIGYRGLSYRETPIYDLDVVEVFGFTNSRAMDYYTYFMSPEGEWMRTVEVWPGEPISLRHEGYLYVIGGPYVHEDRIKRHMVEPVVGSQLAIVDPQTYRLTNIERAVTDEHGIVTFAIHEPGHYYVTAHKGSTSREWANLSLPWLPVIVRERQGR